MKILRSVREWEQKREAVPRSSRAVQGRGKRVQPEQEATLKLCCLNYSVPLSPLSEGQTSFRIFRDFDNISLIMRKGNSNIQPARLTT